VIQEGAPERLTRQLDRVVLNPVAGPLILLSILFLMFQAVFSWAAIPMDWIDSGMAALQEAVSAQMADSLLKSLVVDGIIAGIAGVVIFLPQILILFLFILLLEDFGYMTRAAFLMDRLMSGVGLNGRAFIPLLSSFACAIPGIMATRAIAHPLDRLVTILIAPLMTCSARLPVYVLLIAAFVPATTVWGGIGLQGLVMFGLYATGIVGALAVAGVLRLTLLRGNRQALLMELPSYKWPNPANVLLGLWDRAKIFVRRIGTIILSVLVVLWFLSTFPGAPEGSTEPAIYYSFAGMIGRGLEPLLAPIGFNWQIAIALVPGLAAREVAVAALGTVYALSGDEGAVTEALTTTLAHDWTLATALALLAWYVFAPQCLATLAAARRETNSWRWPVFMFVYLMGLAYVAALVTYRVALALGGG
jgi:ferrous iron transport protein B